MPMDITGQLVRTTEGGEISPLAFQGIKVWTCYQQIRDMLQQRLDDNFILCFAKPVENAGTGKIDWYSPIHGSPKPLSSLPEEQREKIVGHLRAIAGDIENLAEELIHSNEPLKVTRGNIIKLALSYPDSSYIYVIDQQPIITAWGFRSGTPGVEGQILSRLAMPAPEKNARKDSINPAVVSSSDNIKKSAQPGHKNCFIWWILALLCLLLTLWILFTSFGPVRAPGGKAFFHYDGKPFMDDFPDLSEVTKKLQNSIMDLEKKVQDHIAQCKPAKQETIPPEKAAEPVRENALTLPTDPENLEFLAGRWLCETGLANTRTREPVKVLFSFDGKGTGTAKIIENNDQCDGQASAKLDGGKLHIEMGQLHCRRQNTSYGNAVINCANSANNQTLCSGQNYDGTTWDATFLKLR